MFKVQVWEKNRYVTVPKGEKRSYVAAATLLSTLKRTGGTFRIVNPAGKAVAKRKYAA